jgi:hypothetical protein
MAHEPMAWLDTADGWASRARTAEAERDKLAAFKRWVHSYLDAHGVPHHPPGTHGAEGCRIGDRMDWLFAQFRAALARVRLLEGLLRDCRSLEFTAPSNLELLRRDIDAALAGAPPAPEEAAREVAT